MKLSFNSFSLLDKYQPSTIFIWNGLTKYLPLVISVGFFVFSYLWLELGPLDWHLQNSFKLYVLLISATLFLVFGYLFGIRTTSKYFSKTGVRFSPNLLLLISCVVYLILYIPLTKASTGNFFPNFVEAISDPGQAYAQSKASEKLESQVAVYISFLVAPIALLYTPITIFLFRQLSKPLRVLGIICIALQLVLSISKGVNKGVADLATYLTLFFVMFLFAALFRKQWKRVVAAIFGVILTLGLFTGYYANNIGGRVSADVSSIEGQTRTETSINSSTKSDKEKLREEYEKLTTLTVATTRTGTLFEQLPQSIKPIAGIASTYLTHGFKGLSLALEEQWTPTWGLGFSDFLRNNIAKISFLNVDKEEVYENTYPGKILESGWPSGLFWSTALTAIASDLSFPGTVFFMFIPGLILGLSWKDLCLRSDPLASFIFLQTVISIFYLGANNQLFQGGELFVGFIGILFFWLFLRARNLARNVFN